MIKISINEKECLGCNFCESCAPEIFTVDQADFKCKLKKQDNFSPEELKQIQEVADGCPVKAIELNEQ
jgi:ferredoxin